MITSGAEFHAQGKSKKPNAFRLRRLLSLAAVALMVGLIAVTVYADVTGTDQADVIGPGTSLPGETVFGLGGDDTITTAFDNQTVFGGPGDDTIHLLGGNNVNYFGNDGHDTFQLAHSTSTVKANGGRGDDFFKVTADIAADSELIDGPGEDMILDNDASEDYTITLVADNQQDTVILTNNMGGDQVIRLSRGSGRDVIDCQDTDDDEEDTVFLNGNRKAVDTKGNNLRKAALLGGTAESNCDTIIP